MATTSTHIVPLPALAEPHPDLLTAREAAQYLRFGSVLAFKKWARRQAIPSLRRGPKITLWEKACLDQVIRRGDNAVVETT